MVLKGPGNSIWLKLVPFLNGPLIELTDPMLGFFNFFGKDQLFVTASRGVSLMPQLKTAKPAGPKAQCPTLLALRVLFALNVTPTVTD